LAEVSFITNKDISIQNTKVLNIDDAGNGDSSLIQKKNGNAVYLKFFSLLDKESNRFKMLPTKEQVIIDSEKCLPLFLPFQPLNIIASLSRKE
jgi:hypothetical protein